MSGDNAIIPQWIMDSGVIPQWAVEEGVTQKYLIQHLSWRPAKIVDSAICLSETIPSWEPQKPLQSASIGYLDYLPLELIHAVLNSLDFRSLSNLACTSHGGTAAVRSLPAYRNLTKHASAALIALNRMKLITYHSVATIYAALRSENCVRCDEYGPFLFLPTCERCCYRCVQFNHSLSVVSRNMAGMCFGLTPSQLRRIPAMLSLPELKSGSMKYSKRQRPVTLVSLKQARELGLAIHGSQEAMAHSANLRNLGKLTSSQEHQVKLLTRPFSEEVIDLGHYCGAASIGFPSLRLDGGVDEGLWCLGCRKRGAVYTVDLVACRAAFRGMIQARSEAEFIKHVSNCKGAEDLIRQMQKDPAFDAHRNLERNFTTYNPRLTYASMRLYLYNTYA